MLLGVRQFFEKRGGGWQNPYVTDGLVAMWDGEWNAGGGVHDTSNRIVNLCGGSQITLDPSCVIGSNKVSFTTATAFATGDDVGCWGGITSDVPNLPASGERATFEACTNLGHSASWGDFYIGVTFRNGVFYANRHLRYYVLGRNPGGSGMFGHANLTPASYTMASMSGRAAAWNDYTCYYNGSAIQNIPSYSTETKSTDAKVRILGSTVVGSINEFSCLRIYNRALSADEIAANYAIDKARFNLP